MVELLTLIHQTAHLPLPDEPTLLLKAAMWAKTLVGIPPRYLEACYRRAALDHDGTYAVSAPELLQAWKALGAELAYAGRMTAAVSGAPRLPAGPPCVLTIETATTVTALLLAVATHLGEPKAGGIAIKEGWRLTRREPQTSLAQWRTRFYAALTADSAPTLASLCQAVAPAAEPPIPASTPVPPAPTVPPADWLRPDAAVAVRVAAQIGSDR